MVACLSVSKYDLSQVSLEASFMKINVEKTVEEFRSDLLTRSFINDDLTKNSDIFYGVNENSEFLEFEKFSQMELFMDIIKL